MISKEKFIELWVLKDDSIRSVNEMVYSMNIASDKYDELLITERVGLPTFHHAIITLLSASFAKQRQLDATAGPTLQYQKEVLEYRRNIWDAIDLLIKINSANSGEKNNYGHGKRP